MHNVSQGSGTGKLQIFWQEEKDPIFKGLHSDYGAKRQRQIQYRGCHSICAWPQELQGHQGREVDQSHIQRWQGQETSQVLQGFPYI